MRFAAGKASDFSDAIINPALLPTFVDLVPLNAYYPTIAYKCCNCFVSYNLIYPSHNLQATLEIKNFN